MTVMSYCCNTRYFVEVECEVCTKAYLAKDRDLNVNVDSELSEERKSNRYNVSSGDKKSKGFNWDC